MPWPSLRHVSWAAVVLCVAVVWTACADTAGSGAVDSDGDTHNESVDCDDSNPAVHPDAAEVCNGIDDDCDGAIDEGLPVYSSWVDGDGDGYGDPEAPKVETCDEQGRVVLAADCDDADPGIHAFAAEDCNNGVDDDCDGRTDCEDWECAWSEPEQCEPAPSNRDREGTTTTAAATHRIDVEGLMPPIRTAVVNPNAPDEHFVFGRVNVLNGQFNHGFVRIEPTRSSGSLQSADAAILRGKGLVTAVRWHDDGVEGVVDDFYERGFGLVGDLARFHVRIDEPSQIAFETIAELPDRDIHDYNTGCLHPVEASPCEAVLRTRGEEDGVHFDVWQAGNDTFATEAVVPWASFGGQSAEWYLSPANPFVVVLPDEDGVILVDTENGYAAVEAPFTYRLTQRDIGFVHMGLDAAAVRWGMDRDVEPYAIRIAAVELDGSVEEIEVPIPSGMVEPPFAGLGPGRITQARQQMGDTDGDALPEVLVHIQWPNVLDSGADEAFECSALLELDLDARTSRIESVFLNGRFGSFMGPHDWNGDGIDDVTISEDHAMHLFFMR